MFDHFIKTGHKIKALYFKIYLFLFDGSFIIYKYMCHLFFFINLQRKSGTKVIFFFNTNSLLNLLVNTSIHPGQYN